MVEARVETRTQVGAEIRAEVQVCEDVRHSLVNLGTGEVLTGELHVADSFGTRFVGLMGKKGMPTDEGLLLKHCASIHTFFVKFPIDVAYLDRRMTVVAIYQGVRPWRMVTAVERGLHTLEMAAGAFESRGLKVGHRLECRAR